jgi:protein phosphatase
VPVIARLTDTVCGYATSAGNRRTRNEDSVLAGPAWFVVADGMGGHARGDVASQVVVATFAATPPDPGDIRSAISAAIDAANDAVRARGRDDGAAGMGSTIVGLTVSHGGPWSGVAIFHVGDSRCYRLAGGQLRLMTRDHTLVRELIDAGRLTSEQAARHPLRNVVTRAIGMEGQVRADVVLVDLIPSRYLLCSDGLTGELGPRALGRVLTAIAHPQAAADRLVALALEGAADDNVTALVVDVGAARENGRTETTRCRCSP